MLNTASRKAEPEPTSFISRQRMAKSHAKRPQDIIAMIALCAACWLVAPASEANAAANARQRVVQPAKKQEAKKPEAKPAAKTTEPAKSTAGKSDAAKTTAHRKGHAARHVARRGKKPADDDD